MEKENLISYNQYLEMFWNAVKDPHGYHKWFINHLTAEYRIKDNWYPCIPLTDPCVYPFEDCYISVITRNGTREYLKKDEFRLIV